MKKTFFILITLCLSLMLQAQVSKTVNCTAGGLAAALTASEKSTITDLTITGTIDARDFKTMRDSMTVLANVDISKTNVAAYTGNQGTENGFPPGTKDYIYKADAIPQYAFFDRYRFKTKKNFVSVKLPETITFVGKEAFYSCEGITSIEMNCPIISIDQSAFEACTKLIQITLPETLEKIGISAFSTCRAMQSISIPSGTLEIGDNAFSSFYGNIEVASGNSNFCSENGVLFNKQKTVLLQCPTGKKGEYKIPSTVKIIGNSSFVTCNISSVIFPDGIDSIYDEAFWGCGKMPVVNLPLAIKYIGQHAFANMSQLKTFTLPPLITKITNNMIGMNDNLATVILNSSVKEIESLAFQNCPSLKFLSLPLSVTSISRDAFNDFTGLTGIYFASSIPVSVKDSLFMLDLFNKSQCTLYVPVGSLSAYKSAKYWKNFSKIVETTFKPSIIADAGNLSSKIPVSFRTSLQSIIVGGTIDARDFQFMRDSLPALTIVNLQRATIVAYSGTAGTRRGTNISYAANAVPPFAFCDSLKTNLSKTVLQSIIFPSTTTVIGKKSFMNCDGLYTVWFPPSVKSIEESAFESCEHFCYAFFSTGLETIGKSSFYMCEALQIIEIPNTVTSIGEMAFYSCDEAVSITLSESLTKLSKSSFTACRQIKSIIIPSSVKVIEERAFASCSKLTSVDIPNSVTSLGASVFSFCDALTSVTIPFSVGSIGSMAFYYCLKLAQINALNPVPVDLTGSPTVFKDVNLITCILYVPFGSKHLYETADQWKDFTHIVEMPFDPTITTVAGKLSTHIPAAARDTLTTLAIKGTIDARDFRFMRDSLPMLAVLDIENVDVVAYSGTEGTDPQIINYTANEIPVWAFCSPNTYSGKLSLTTVKLPESAISIGRVAFDQCSNMSYVKFPPFLISIGDLAFRGCHNLKGKLNLPESVTTIEYGAFIDCIGLTEIEIPKSVKIIGRSAFEICIGLTSINISTVKIIESRAFACCYNLEYINITESVERIDKLAFIQVKGPFKVSDSNKNYSDNEGVLYSKDQSVLLSCPLSKSGTFILPTTVKIIESYAFGNTPALKNIILPNLLDKIKLGAFSNLQTLTSIALPSSITEIDSFAFFDCRGLTAIYSLKPIPIDLSSSSQVFGNVNISTCTLYVPLGSKHLYETADQWKDFNHIVEMPFDPTITTVAGKLSTHIPAAARDTLTTLTIKGNIDARDFRFMRDSLPILAYLDIEDVDVVKYSGYMGTYPWGENYYPANTIPKNAFFLKPEVSLGKQSLISVNFPSSITSIDTCAFCACLNLYSVTIPLNVTFIATSAFSSCKGLTSINIPASVTLIDFIAFNASSGLINVAPNNQNYSSNDFLLFNKDQTNLIHCSVSISGSYSVSSSVTSISKYAFAYCSHLISVSIPSTINKIESSVFLECNSLMTFTIPSSVGFIGEFAFGGCKKLTSIYANRLIPVDLSSSPNVFLNVNKTTCTLYVPVGSKHLYETAYQWKDFVHIVEMGSDVNNITTVAGELYTHIPAAARDTLTTLAIKGTIDARDFRFMRDSLPMLAVLDIEDVLITAYNGTEGTYLSPNFFFQYPANAIPASAFFNSNIPPFNTKLKTVIFPKSISVISQMAFYSCSSLTKINFPITLTNIEYGAFSWCLGIDSIKIPSFVTEIGQSVFRCCSGFITVDKNNPNYSSSEGVLFNKNKTELIQCPTSKVGSYTIPSSVITIGYEAFEWVKGIKVIVIPNSVKYIEKEAFLNCDSLISLNIPSTVTLIKDYTFSGCLNLPSINIPSSVTSIQNNAFSTCISLTSIILPSSVTLIGIHAFSSCANLISITIPSTIDSIGTYAFSYCNKLDSISVNRAIPVDLSSSPQVFYNVNKTTCTLYVPFGSKHLYETADQWKDFTHIVEMGNFILSDLTLNVPGKGGNVSTTITSNANWTVTCDQPWLTVTPTSGTGNDSLVFTAEPNQTDSIRTATVTVSAAGVPSHIITVTQNPVPVLTVSSNTLFIAKGTGSSASADVTSNIAWIAQSNQPWLRATPSIGTGNKTIVFSANNANPTISTRTATVTITGTDAVPQLITITQAAGDTVLTVAASSIIIGYTEGSTASIAVTSNTTWTAISDQAWLTVAPATAKGNGTLNFTARANPADSIRMALVTVTADGVTSKVITVTQNRKPFLNVSVNTVNIAREYGSTATVDITSNISWSAETNQEWLKVSPKNSSGNNSLVFTTMSANPKTTTRSATVTVSGDGVPPQLITVIQAAGDTILKVNDLNLNIGYAQGSTAWTIVTSNTLWRVETDQTWLTPNPASSEGNKNLIFTASVNPDGSIRIATVTILALGAETITITITQAPQPLLTLMTDTIYISKEEGSSAEIAVNSNVGWSAVPEKEWLTATPGSGFYNDTVTVKATANPGVGKRSSVVSISGVGVGIKRVTVIQEEGDPILLVSATAVSVAKEKGSNGTVTLTSNTYWTAASDQTWLEVNPDHGNGDAVINFTAGLNPTIKERTATVTILVTGLEPKLITVLQAAGDTVLTVLNKEIRIGAKEGSTTTVEVTSNIQWTITTNEDWLTIKPASGTGNGTITFTAKANPSKDDRPVYVILSSPGAETQTILVVQLAGSGNVINQLSEKSVSLFPNPVTEGFRVSGLGGKAELTLFDLNGKRLLVREINGTEYIPADFLEKGVYFVKITTFEGTIEKKLIKE